MFSLHYRKKNLDGAYGDGYMSLSGYDDKLKKINGNHQYSIVEIYNVRLDVTDIDSYEIENLRKVVRETPLYKVSKRII